MCFSVHILLGWRVYSSELWFDANWLFFLLLSFPYLFLWITCWPRKILYQSFNFFLFGLSFFNCNYFIYIDCFWLDFIFDFVLYYLILLVFLSNLIIILLIAIFSIIFMIYLFFFNFIFEHLFLLNFYVKFDANYFNCYFLNHFLINFFSIPSLNI